MRAASERSDAPLLVDNLLPFVASQLDHAVLSLILVLVVHSLLGQSFDAHLALSNFAEWSVSKLVNGH